MRGVQVVLGALLVAAAAVAQDAPPRPGDVVYRVGIGDLLSVDAYQHEEVSGTFPVGDGGCITYPMLGEVPVAGRTAGEVARLLETLLEKDFYVDVQLVVEVTEYRSQPVTVLGEVGQPGPFFLKGRTTLIQLLSEVGGLRASAGPSVELHRVEQVDGQEVQRVWTFSLKEVLIGGPGSEVEVAAGDVVSVAAKQLFFVTGEIASPGQYEISLSMTLMQALSTAGGEGKFSSQEVELHREVNGQKEILRFNLARIRKGKDPDPAIQGGDVIIVKRRFF